MRYSQKIAYQACGSASSSAVDRTAAYDISHYEEIIDKALRADEIEFSGEAIFNCLGGFSVTPANPFAALRGKEGEMVLVFVEVMGENGLKTVPCSMASP